MEHSIDSTHTIANIVAQLSKERIQRRLHTHASRILPRTLVLVISPLDGNELSYLCDYLSKDSLAIGISFSALHETEYQQHPLAQSFPSLTHIPLLYGSTIESTILQYMNEYYFHNVELIYYSKEAYEYKTQAANLYEKCQRELAQIWKNHATASFLGMRWIKNIIHNSMASNYIYGIPISHLSPPRKNHIAIVIGAGPSLDRKTLEFIKYYQDTCTIFAADTALPTLQYYGIIPHYCVLLEGQYYNMKDLIPIPHPKIVAIGDICCYPPSLRAFSTTASLSSQFSPISFFSQYGPLLPPPIPPVGSVGVLALFLALQYNPTHILLAGLDFSYYKGKSHSVHSPAYHSWMSTHNKIHPWSPIHAHLTNKTLSNTASHPHTRVEDPTMKMFRNTVERMLLPLAHKIHIPCYDLNQESIIEGLSTITIQEASKLCTHSVSTEVNWTTDIPYSLVNNTSSYNNNNGDIPLSTLFQKQCAVIATRMQELSQEQSYPTQEDWESGLDTFTFLLPDDPYALRFRKEYWIENNIYSKVYMVANIWHSYIENLSKDTQYI